MAKFSPKKSTFTGKRSGSAKRSGKSRSSKGSKSNAWRAYVGGGRSSGKGFTIPD